MSALRRFRRSKIVIPVEKALPLDAARGGRDQEAITQVKPMLDKILVD